MATNVRTAPLSFRRASTCQRCGATVWIYPMLSGTEVALDSAAGEFIIDGREHAWRLPGMSGYRLHSCETVSGSLLIGSVSEDEFLWQWLPPRLA